MKKIPPVGVYHSQSHSKLLNVAEIHDYRKIGSDFEFLTEWVGFPKKSSLLGNPLETSLLTTFYVMYVLTIFNRIRIILKNTN